MTEELSEIRIYEESMRVRALELATEATRIGSVHQSLSDYLNAATLIENFIKNGNPSDKKSEVQILSEDKCVDDMSSVALNDDNHEGEWNHFVDWVRESFEDFSADKWKQGIFEAVVNGEWSNISLIVRYTLPRNSGVTTFLSYLASYMSEFEVNPRPVKFVVPSKTMFNQFDRGIRDTVLGFESNVEEVSIATADEYWKYSPSNIVYITDNCSLKYGLSNDFQRCIEISNV